MLFIEAILAFGAGAYTASGQSNLKREHFSTSARAIFCFLSVFAVFASRDISSQFFLQFCSFFLKPNPPLCSRCQRLEQVVLFLNYHKQNIFLAQK
jgi:hypothetical protein